MKGQSDQSRSLHTALKNQMTGLGESISLASTILETNSDEILNYVRKRA